MAMVTAEEINSLQSFNNTPLLQTSSHEQYGGMVDSGEGTNMRNEAETTTTSNPQEFPILEKIRNMMDENVWSGFIFVAIYMFAGIVAYSFLFEDWDIVDSLYFSMVTFTTVGYGDLSPESQMGRLFSCVYAIAGIVIIGAIFGTIAEHVAESQIQKIKEREMRAQETAMSLMQGQSRNRSSSEESSTEEALFAPKDWTEFLITLKPYIKLLIPFILMAWLIGRNQDWTIIDILYFVVCTMTTIGYGDLSPNTTLSRLLAIFFIPFSVFSLASIFGAVAAFSVERKAKEGQESILQRGFRMSDLDLMDKDRDGQISELEFVEFMLLSTDKVEKEFLDRLHAQFRSLDRDGSGMLDRSDIVMKIQASCSSMKHGMRSSGADTFYDCENDTM